MPSFHADAIEDCRHNNIMASIQCGSVTRKLEKDPAYAYMPAMQTRQKIQSLAALPCCFEHSFSPHVQLHVHQIRLLELQIGKIAM